MYASILSCLNIAHAAISKVHDQHVLLPTVLYLPVYRSQFAGSGTGEGPHSGSEDIIQGPNCQECTIYLP